MDNQQLITLFTEHTGKQPCSVDELPSSGSNRRYFRLRAEGTPSIIGVLGTSVDENRAFIYMARHFATRGLPVPTILAVSDDDMCYLQTDLGDRMLFKEIEKGRATRLFSAQERELLDKTVRLLPKIQFAGAQGMDFGLCFPAVAFD